MKGGGGKDPPGEGLGDETNDLPAQVRHWDDVPAQVRHPGQGVVQDALTQAGGDVLDALTPDGDDVRKQEVMKQ